MRALPNCILADPPWARMGGGKHPRNAAQPYETMTDAELRAWSASLGGATADTAMLFLWTPQHLVPFALELMGLAAFVYEGCVTWVKTNPQHLVAGIVKPQTEHLLVGVRGDFPDPDDGHENAIPTLIMAPKTKHSRKPGIVYDYIERLSEEVGLTRRLEWFAREAQPGWRTIGDQVQETLFSSAPEFTGTLAR